MCCTYVLQFLIMTMDKSEENNGLLPIVNDDFLGVSWFCL